MSPNYAKKKQREKEKEKIEIEKNSELIQLESRAQYEGNLMPSALSQLVRSH